MLLVTVASTPPNTSAAAMPRMDSTRPMAAQIRRERDQFLRFSLVSLENPHTKNITRFTTGILATSSIRVKSHMERGLVSASAECTYSPVGAVLGCSALSFTPHSVQKDGAFYHLQITSIVFMGKLYHVFCII